MTRVLGVEGTAWCASAAVYDADADDVFIESDAYLPESGGIHPREAAEHMREAVPDVVGTALEHARETADGDGPPVDGAERSSAGKRAPPVDAVAFSRGPGLGPCLRVVATAARALAGALDVPLVGVNHMVAHLEIGRHRSGFSDPVCLNASGANAHLLGYRNGRYRVLGETMDTGVGNAIDKFTRHLGWSHPGGPKVERRAREGEYLDLPYVVKGMDFSFSGIASAAQEAVDDGADVADVCFSLQENVFAMLTEVSERALSLTDADELVLGGGVGQNDRLREMLREMCEARGADFFAPEPRFLRDNAGMIAVLGAKMYDAGDTIAIEESRVLPDFRPDEVPVTWRSEAEGTEASEKPSGEREGERSEPSDRRAGEAGEERSDPRGRSAGDEPVRSRRADGDEIRGAEALVTMGERVRKERVPKGYRHPALDERLRRERTRSEARITSEARREGVPTPVVYDVDPPEASLAFERVGDADLRDALTEERVRALARHLARCHAAGFVHGDPTPRNARVDGERVYLIDFGLGYYTDDAEDYAMDLHVLSEALAGTADDADALLSAAEAAYREAGEPAVVDQLREIEGRGRYRSGGG